MPEPGAVLNCTISLFLHSPQMYTNTYNNHVYIILPKTDGKVYLHKIHHSVLWILQVCSLQDPPVDLYPIVARVPEPTKSLLSLDVNII